MQGKDKIYVPNDLILMCNSLNIPWGIKDTNSCFVYANDDLRNLFSLPKGYDIEGRYDNELPSPVAEFYREFQIQDQQVQTEATIKRSLEIHPYRNGVLEAYIAEKMPFFQDGKIVGVLGYARKVNYLSFSDSVGVQQS